MNACVHTHTLKNNYLRRLGKRTEDYKRGLLLDTHSLCNLWFFVKPYKVIVSFWMSFILYNMPLNYLNILYLLIYFGVVFMFCLVLVLVFKVGVSYSLAGPEISGL